MTSTVQRPGPRQHMTIKDLAAELNISSMAAHKLVTSGQIPAVDIGTGQRSYWRIDREDYEKYLGDQRARTARRFGAP